jgi:hypothetical protein
MQPQPFGQVAILAQITKARQHAYRLAYRVEPENAHGARLRLQQPEQVLDQRCLAGAVLADQPEHDAARHAQADLFKRGIAAKTA